MTSDSSSESNARSESTVSVGAGGSAGGSARGSAGGSAVAPVHALATSQLVEFSESTRVIEALAEVLSQLLRESRRLALEDGVFICDVVENTAALSAVERQLNVWRRQMSAARRSSRRLLMFDDLQLQGAMAMVQTAREHGSRAEQLLAWRSCLLFAGLVPSQDVLESSYDAGPVDFAYNMDNIRDLGAVLLDVESRSRSMLRVSEAPVSGGTWFVDVAEATFTELPFTPTEAVISGVFAAEHAPHVSQVLWCHQGTSFAELKLFLDRAQVG